VIGENCIIGQGITVGGKSKEIEVPKIGDYVYIAAGSSILGPITRGNQIVMAANTVVTKGVANHTMVGGVPATVVKENIRFDKYV